MEQVSLQVLVEQLSDRLTLVYKDKITARRNVWWMLESMFKKKTG